MTNLEGTLKSRDVTLPAKIRLVKAIINIAVFQTQGYLLKLRRASPLLCEARLRLPGGACSPGAHALLTAQAPRAAGLGLSGVTAPGAAARELGSCCSPTLEPRLQQLWCMG